MQFHIFLILYLQVYFKFSIFQFFNQIIKTYPLILNFQNSHFAIWCKSAFHPRNHIFDDKRNLSILVYLIEYIILSHLPKELTKAKFPPLMWYIYPHQKKPENNPEKTRVNTSRNKLMGRRETNDSSNDIDTLGKFPRLEAASKEAWWPMINLFATKFLPSKFLPSGKKIRSNWIEREQRIN